MNILINELPKKIKVNENIFDINYDYRTIIRILTAFEDKELTVDEKVYIMIKNLYKEDLCEKLKEHIITEDDYYKACEQAKKFIDCEGKFSADGKNDVRIYSFTQDANYIFSGINSTHHIDIEKESDLHWWKFMSFFMDMSQDCFFGELTYYRKRKATGKLTREEKKQYKEIKELVEINEENIEGVQTQSKARQEFFELFHK